jgi:hypothetical protein
MAGLFGLHKEKFKISPYYGVDFRDDPIDRNYKFDIYYPKHQNKVQEIIQKDQQNRSRYEDEWLTFTGLKNSKYRQKLYDSLEFSKSSVGFESSNSYRRATDNAVNQSLVTPGTETMRASTMDNNHNSANTRGDQSRREVKIFEPNKDSNEQVDQVQIHANGKTLNNSMGNNNASSINNPNNNSAQTAQPSRRLRAVPSEGKTITLRKSGAGKSLRNMLYIDDRTGALPRTARPNQMIESILRDEDNVVNKPELMNSVIQLKKMQLLRKKNAKLVDYQNSGRVNFIYNDYHSKSTNPGYSRNSAGSFYCR